MDVMGNFVPVAVSFGAELDDHKGGHYSIVGAKIIRPNSEYRVVVTTFDVIETVQFRVSIAAQDNILATENLTLSNNESRVISLSIGNIPVKRYELVAEGLSGIVFKKKVDLQYDNKFCSVLIQTDKSVYKPGDTVRYRVLLLDRNMKPSLNESSMMIYITDGQSNRIKQWTNVDLGDAGVFEGELPLSTEPVLGTWNINVEVLGVKQLKPFDVDEYVLPTFEVTVKSSGYTTVEDESLLVTVNAKYTYGKPVAGELTVTVKAQQQHHLFGDRTPANLCQKVVQTDGKSVVEFHLRDELKLETMHIRDFLVEAEVRELLTGRTLRGSTDVKIHEDRYTVTMVEEKKYVPGLPYHAWLKVSNLDGSPVQESSIIVLVRNGSKVQLKNYSLDASGSISLDLNLDRMNFNYLRIEALYCGKSYELQGIQKPFEDKEAHLRVGAKDKEPSAGKEMELEVCCTKPLKYVAYAVLSRGSLLHGGVVHALDSQKTAKINLPSMCAMVPRTKVVVHYVSNAGSVISDNATVEFRNVFENHIQVGLSHETVKPGDAIDISVKAKEDSFVGLLAVDQSVLLLKSGNDITKQCFTKELEAYDTSSSESSDRPYRRYYDRQSFPDFEDVGAVFISNPLVPKASPNAMACGQLFGCAAPAGMAFGAPPMMQMRKMACDMQMESAHIALPEKEPTIRSNFPETWIWESVQKCKGEGELIRKIVPDTVTSWIISGFSLSKAYGLGLMEAPVKMSVFLPFFISIDLPYSVKHGETVRIPVVVFNYLNEDQTADVIFFNKDQEFEFVPDDSESRIHEEHHRRMQVALPKDGGKTLSFTVKPKKVGHITLKITATCALAGDGIERELLVEPEGVPQYINKARLIDLRSESSVAQTFDIDIPNNAVPNSTKVEVSVIGDVLGSSIENLDSLIRMPFGCGEQNMLNFVPCIVVLDYLIACRRLTSELEGKAKKCMEVGYQRELTYKHADGSFSAFGQSDERGSTWLTAFVAKSFLQAAKYIGVEMPIVESALEWLSKVQTADGAFPEVGTICHKDMQGGAAGGLALTAYTVLAFLENRQLAAKYASTVDKAFTYIGQQVEKECDVYSYALVAYALQLADHKLKDGVMQKLESCATAEGDMKWWSKPVPKQDSNKVLECCWNRPCSVNVEMSAYALLASLVTSSGLEGLPIMKWLISQRNDKGGFQSTQDTVVGLEALAKMAAKVSSSESNVTVTVKAADDVERSLTVNQENALVLQKHQLPETVSSVAMTANGTGCALFQLSYKYNIKDVDSSPRFTLVPSARKGKLESCIDLSVRTSFVPTADQPVSNMAVMEVDMPSGFVVEKDSLKTLKEGTVVKKIETKRGDTTVVLYFDNIGVTCVEVALAAFRKHEVTNAKPANVIIYDYYDNTRCARSFYECSTGSGSSVAKMRLRTTPTRVLRPSLLFLALVCFITGSQATATGHYTVVGAKLLRPNSEYHVSVTNQDVAEPVRFSIAITTEDSLIEKQEITLNRGETRLVPFAIGDIAEGSYKLVAEGLSGLTFKNETSLEFQPKGFSVFVQTDKSIYKPGDTVRFRVLVLDPNTKPLAKADRVVVYIEDGKGNRIKHWKDGMLIKGVFESELTLSTAPVLGAWTIYVDALGKIHRKVFEVDEYVLPKFEVTIESPGITTFKDGKVKAIVRSKYTYGKPVKGEATISVRPEFGFHYVQPFEKDVITRKVIPIDGKGSAEFDLRQELRLEGDYTRNVIIDAVVEEELTGRKQNATTKVTVHDRRYKLEVVKSDDNFKPGLPYTAWLKVSFQDGSPVQDTANQVEVEQTTYESTPIKRNYTLNANGMAKLVVDTDVNGTYINLRATYLGHDFYLSGISKADSEVDSYIRARVLTELPTVGKDVVVEVAATAPMKFFTYQLLGRGDVLLSNTVAVPETTLHTFKFPAIFAMVPRAKLVVYYIAPNGDMVSDSKVIQFDSELQNFMKVTLSKEQTKPGQDVEITVSTNPDSYVGLLGVDQSVLLLKSGNDITKEDVFSELEKYEERSYGYYRRKRSFSWRPYGEHRDFSSVGAFVLSNANDPPPNNTLLEPPIYKFHRAPNGTVLYTSIEKPRALQKHVLVTNTRPPLAGPFAFSRLPRPHRDIPRLFLSQEIQNTWLFDNTYSGFSGEKTLQKKVPDTITSWIITGFSVNPIYGLGLTQKPRKLNVFLPFFVSTNLPYSVKRGEVVAIPIVVFNYLDEDLTADVVLENSEQEFEFADVENEVVEPSKLELFRQKRLAIPSNTGMSVSFMVKPKKLGHITIKVKATSTVAGDAVERQLLVEPEGLPQYINKAAFVDLRATKEATKNFTVEIPKNAVPDSTRIEIAVIGDVLGSTIQNLDSLIRMPYGCGEQNMLNFVPNIVVLDYLTATNKLTASVEAKAKKFMEAGYQRELSYKHKDGSFSAFGESDKSGSTWLTAFVARSFKQAAKHITVDEAVIDKSLEWLSDHQAPNGSFPEVGVVSHKDMQGGSGGGVALTAYTLIAFLENINLVDKYKNTINKAIDYVYRNTESLDDTYALALAAYALQLADHSSKGYILSKLDTKATTDSDSKWWHKPVPESDTKNPWNSRPNSVNVEMSAYGMLAFIEAGLDTDALPVMKWLIGQRNDKGGFQSTQDTVVGLQALAKMAAKISSANNDVAIVAKINENQEKRMNVNADNGMILQKLELPSATRHIELKATGTGFAIVQLAYKYNMNVTGEWPRFVLDPQVNANSNPDHLHLSVCTSFVPSAGQNVSNMAVMEVGFPSGFTADSDTLPSLENMPFIKKVETKDGDTTVVLYFDSLDQRELCPTISAFRTHKVAKQKPAPVVIYDYYDNSRIARQFYEGPKASLCDICEKEDCGDACSIRSQKQRSPADAAALNNTMGHEWHKSAASSLPASVVTFLLAAVIVGLVQ
ncbi:uncharacterized protein LOC128270884 [Anopheles cruzii]|uniref:uncharacterized protein LOC128270884 n=1 Tax=Anopheles cruzii TaxID=68878 RepID=UPI0022EC1CE3|nr:uncharacterized protein LOC128270884 [Anopheles cruzii]